MSTSDCCILVEHENFWQVARFKTLGYSEADRYFSPQQLSSLLSRTSVTLQCFMQSRQGTVFE